MEVVRVQVPGAAGDGERAQLLSADVVSYKGSNWFVAKWCERPAEGLRSPERIVCLDAIPHQRVDYGTTRFLIDAPIPRAVLYGDAQAARESGYLVEDRPDIQVQKPR